MRAPLTTAAPWVALQRRNHDCSTGFVLPRPTASPLRHRLLWHASYTRPSFACIARVSNAATQPGCLRVQPRFPAEVFAPYRAAHEFRCRPVLSPCQREHGFRRPPSREIRPSYVSLNRALVSLASTASRLSGQCLANRLRYEPTAFDFRLRGTKSRKSPTRARGGSCNHPPHYTQRGSKHSHGWLWRNSASGIVGYLSGPNQDYAQLSKNGLRRLGQPRSQPVSW
jgi:hypothetical protein